MSGGPSVTMRLRSRDLRAELLPTIALLGAVLLWSSAFAAIRVELRGFDPATLAFVRFACASIVLAAIAAVRRLPLPSAADATRIAAAATLLFVIYQVALNYGERSVNAGTASLLAATAPLFTAIVAAIFLRERLGRIGALGMLIGFSGAAIVAMAAPGDVKLDVAALVILGAAAAEALAFVIQKPCSSDGTRSGSPPTRSPGPRCCWFRSLPRRCMIYETPLPRRCSRPCTWQAS